MKNDITAIATKQNATTRMRESDKQNNPLKHTYKNFDKQTKHIMRKAFDAEKMLVRSEEINLGCGGRKKLRV